MNWKLVYSLLVAGLIVFSTGCGDDDDNDDDTSGGTGGATAGEGGSDAGEGGAGGTGADVVKETVSAADGGTVATKGETASLDIPAGALSEDTEISIETLDKADQPDSDNLGSDAFDIGPDGTTFEKPVTLTLKLDGNVPEGKTAKLAVLEGGKWEPITGSSVSGDKVSAEIEHLSLFVIIFVGEEAVLITPECADFTFEACGGDLVGKWNLLNICYEGVVGDNPFQDTPECQDVIFAVDMEIGGTVEFKADNTYEVTIEMGAATMHIEADDDCMMAVTMQDSGSAGCDLMNQSMGPCTYDAGACSCDSEMGSPGGTQTETGTYITDGSDLTMTDDEDQSVDEGQYCVSGTKATFEMKEEQEGEVQVSYAILEKL